MSLSKKIGYITTFFPGTSETHHMKQSGYQYLIFSNFKRGIKPNIFVGCRKIDFRINYKFNIKKFYPILPIGIPFLTSKWYINPYLEFKSIMSDLNILHHLYLENTYFISNFLKKILHKNIKLVATLHQPENKFQKIMPKSWIRSLEKLDSIICLGKKQKAFFNKKLKKPKIYFIPHGVQSNYFLKSSCENMDCICSGMHLRDHKFLFDVIKQVLKRQNKIHFHIVGKLNEKIFNREYLKNIHFYHSISDEELKQLYGKNSLMILPLRDCVGSNSLLEGLASGLPIIASNVGDIKDYTNNKNSILISNNDEKKMSDAIIQVMTDFELRKKMSRESISLAKKFDWKVISEKTIKIYNKIIT